ncbi:fungal-specific transcription factor domain-containing protein [Xylogone sp. PMI_703]|nr:fungal-specific transcription factor domain-containing protein [Xylogone sp. PMI_703]
MISILDFHERPSKVARSTTPPSAPRRLSKPKRPTRTKTFSGCWTCRARHVKCDEQKPCCKRCLNSSLTCQGYGLRLSWVKYSPDKAELTPLAPHALNSYNTLPLNHGLPNLSASDIAAVLDSLGDGPDLQTSKRIGPFSVFPTSVIPFTATSPSSICDGKFCSTLKSCSDNYISTIPSSSDDNSSKSNEGSRSTSEVVDEWPSIQVVGEVNPELPTIQRHMDLLPAPARQKELVHHWISFLAKNLQPVDTSANLFRDVFLPMGISGLFASSKESNGRIALFHALCSTAAYSLLQLTGNNGFYDLALKHDQLAIIHLRHSISCDSEVQDEALPLAIVMHIVSSTVSGRASDWRSHILGAIKWLLNMSSSSRKPQKLVSPLVSPLVSQVILAAVVPGNINLPMDVLSFLNINAGDVDYIGPKSGLSRNMLHNLLEITRLRRANDAPEPQELATLEAQINLEDPKLRYPDTIDSQIDAIANELSTFKQHLADVFYYATLIYFKRALMKAPRSEVQDMVEKALRGLEAMENTNHSSCGGCISAWPCVVIATECEALTQRERVIKWFRQKRRHGFNNMNVACTISMMVWQMRHLPGNENLYWQDMGLDPELDALLL